MVNKDVYIHVCEKSAMRVLSHYLTPQLYN